MKLTEPLEQYLFKCVQIDNKKFIIYKIDRTLPWPIKIIILNKNPGFSIGGFKLNDNVELYDINKIPKIQKHNLILLIFNHFYRFLPS